MEENDREQEFVFRYFQSGKLDTQKALRKVKARLASSGQALSSEAGVWQETSVELEKRSKLQKGRLISYRWMAVAASLLILLAVGAYTLLQPKTITYASGSEVMACHLPDGTYVTLSPHSSVSYREDNCRKVEMEGCAYFQVKHDEQHPFDVNGERGHVRVLGTQFMVDERKQGKVEVMVTSGKVFFSARDSQEGLLLVKGKQARLASGGKKPKMIGGYDVNDVAWATHQLHFDNTPLSKVLRQLSECNGGKKLGASDMDKRLTGDFTTDSLQQTIKIIEQTLDVKIFAE